MLLTFAFLLLLPLYSAKLKAKNSIAAIATLDACANEGFGKRQKRGIVSTLVALKVKSVLGVGGRKDVVLISRKGGHRDRKKM